jgi:hypothetical protein
MIVVVKSGNDAVDGSCTNYRPGDPGARRLGGYHGYSRYGGPGLGGVLGLVLIVIIVLWLVGGLHV